MNKVTVFVNEKAVTLPFNQRVSHAIRAYLARRDPDLVKLVERDQLYAVDPTGHQLEADNSLVEGMRIFVRKKSFPE
ncbi:hypothetical protein [Effusibacillus dendaii]|uniref:Uncharacterized protein n=1 Tax=Effusibacillus dendaii TaxID=2743772 RepID=A0A7I8D8D8_9BACL|nr:hypothetical protein [Effusibacillus dendaii]BCJ86413.1 hypothetical protein skT53_13980 [Effusibacillus dendaii]